MGWKEVGGRLGARPGQGRAGQGRTGRRAGQGRRFPRHACTSISALGLVCLVKVLGFRVCGLSFGSKVT